MISVVEKVFVYLQWVFVLSLPTLTHFVIIQQNIHAKYEMISVMVNMTALQ